MKRKIQTKMKRVFALLLCVVTLCGTIPVMSLATAEEDMSFESFTAWKYDGNGKLDMGAGVSGNAATITNATKATKLISDCVNVTAGQKYKVGVSIKATAQDTAEYALAVQFYQDAEQRDVVGDEQIVAQGTSAGDFQEIAGDITVPNGAKYVQMLVKVGHADSKKEDVYAIDNAYLYAYSSAVTLYDNETAAGYQKGEWYRTNTTWTNNTDRYMEVVEEGYKNNNVGSLHIVNNTAAGDMWVGIQADTVAGKEYTISLCVKGSVALAGQTFRFAEYDKIDTAEDITASQISFADWTEKSWDFTSTGNGLFCLAFSQYNWESDMYVDDIKVIDKETGNDILNGHGDFVADGSNKLIETKNLLVNGDFEDVNYKYLPISEFNGTFEGVDMVQEELKWTLNDNATNDTITTAADGVNGEVLKVTKGATAEAGTGWVTVSSELIEVDSQKSYHLTLDMRGEGNQPYYIGTVFYFDAEGTFISSSNLDKEGSLDGTMTPVSADFETPINAAKAQLRIVFQGAAGDVMYLNNVVVNPTETVADVQTIIPTLKKSTDADADICGQWYHQTNIGTAFNSTHYIEVADDGADNPGSLHFVNTSPEGDMQLSIRKDVPAGSYEVSMWVKGSVALADQTFHLRNGDTPLVDLTPQASYAGWTEITGEFSVSSQLYYMGIFFSQYNWETDYYIDNIRIVNKATGVDIMSGAGDFVSYDSDVEQLKKSTDADADTCGQWYHQTNIGNAFNDTHYIEIAEDGADNPGSLHFVQSSSKTEGDMQLSIRKDVPAGSYKVSMKVKGSVALADQAFHLRNGDTSLVDLTPKASYAGWTEITGEFSVSSQLYYLGIFFSQYNWGTDYYIDNMRIVNKETGVDIMSGAGDFCKLKTEIDEETNLMTEGTFENKKTLVVPKWIVSGLTDYEDHTITLYKNTKLTSLRYDIEGGEIYEVALDGSDGVLTVTFDKGDIYTLPTNKGWFVVPDDATNMRVVYEAAGKDATIKEISLKKNNNPENFDFELKAPDSEKPFNWNDYPNGASDTAYTMKWKENAGVDKSAAMEVVVNEENEGSIVIHSKRIKVEPSTVYNISFEGKYEGSEIHAVPFIQLINKKGEAANSWKQALESKTGDGKWHTYESNFSTNEDTAYIEVRFELVSKRADGRFLFDNIVLKTLGSAENPNLDFELGENGKIPLNWESYERNPETGEEAVFGKHTVVKAENASKDGSAAAWLKKTIADDTQFYFKSAMIPVTENTNYIFTYDAKVTGTKNGSLQILIRQFKDIQGNSVANESESFYWMTGAYANGSFDWKQCGDILKTAKDATYIQILFAMVGEETCNVYLDNVSLTETDIVDTPNFDFELKAPIGEKPLNWSSYMNGAPDSAYTMRQNPTAGVNGSGAMEVITNEANSGSIVIHSQRIAVQPSTVYNITFEAKYKGSQIHAVPFIQLINEKGEAVNSWKQALESKTGDGQWHTYESNFSTAKDTVYIEVRFELISKKADGRFWFDDVVITKLGSAEKPNLDFELGENKKIPLNWEMFERNPDTGEEAYFGKHTVQKAEKASVDGSAAAWIHKDVADDTQLYFRSTMLPITGNTNYLFTYDAMVRGTKKGALQIFIRQYKDEKATSVANESETYYWMSDAYMYGSFDWQECGGVFKTAKDAKYIQLMFVVTGDEKCDVYLDNVSFTKTSEIDDPNLDFEYVTAGKPVNWEILSADGISSVTADKKVYYRGNYSLHLQKKYSRINYTTFKSKKPIAVDGGDEIEFVIHMQSKDAVSGTFAASLEGLDANGNVIQSWHGQERPLNASDKLSGWTEYRLPYTVSKNVKSVRLYLRVGGKQADVYFDSVELYNYTSNDNKVYVEDFKTPSSDGMFGGWSRKNEEGNPEFGTKALASISGKNKDNGFIYTDIEVLKTDYVYGVQATYRTEGSATGRLVIEGYDWRDCVIREVVAQELKDTPANTQLETSFTAFSAAYYRVRFEKTGGEGEVFLDNLSIQQTGEPSNNTGWAGGWIVHPKDYDTVLTQYHNERYYYYRQEFTLDSDVKSAQMQLTADDKADIYVNGEMVYQETRTGDTWDLPTTLDLSTYLKKGKNVIAVKMYNDVYAYGLLYDGIVKMENDSSFRFYSDESVYVAREKVEIEGKSNSQWTESDAANFMNTDYDMSKSGGWVPAEVYAEVGGGAWGIISFDNTEYSDYKIQSDSFTFPKDKVFAGDTVEVEAEMMIEEELPETSTFSVYYWKRNTTSKICAGTLSVTDGKTTASWPVGKKFTAKFTLRIPDFLAEGQYTIQFDNNVAIVSDYYINNKIGNVKVQQQEKEVTTTSEVKIYNGKPTYFVEGVATAPLWYSRPERDGQFDTAEMIGMAEAGIDTAISFILPRETLGEVWQSDGTLKTETIDKQMLGTLAANPQAKLMVAIDTAPPQWWLDENPDECVKLSDGTISRESFASEKWREESGETILKIIDYLMEQPYANNIVGFKITGGYTYEWQWWGITGQQTETGDFSSVGLEAFRNWLKETYENNEKLQKAWRDSKVTFENATIPSIDARSESEFQSMLNTTASRDVLDYMAFMGDMKTDAILYFTELVKEHINDRLIVGTYAGYLLNNTTNEFALGTGMSSFQRLLESDSIDYITCPWIYSEREIGYSGDYMSTVDSVTAHGKLYIAEDDNRNHTSYMADAPDSRASVGWTRTTEQTIEQLKRYFSYAISKGCGLYFYSISGEGFIEPQVHEMASQMMQEMTLSLGLERESVSDVAVFYDEESPNYLPMVESTNLKNELLYKSLTMFQRRELYNIGAPYDTYLLDDLEKGLVPEHKVYIMAMTTQITDTEREAIEKQLKKDGNVIIWLFASGISDGETMDVANMEELIGMDLTIAPIQKERKLMGTVEVTNYQHWLTEGLSDVAYGAMEYATLSPVIGVTDSKATAIGVHTADSAYPDNFVGLAVKEIREADGSEWTSIYSAVPEFPTALLRNILEHQGCHIYDEISSDVVYADNNYVAVHSLFAGERTIKLPENAAVYDVFNRKFIVTDADEFTFTMEKAGTYLFRLSEPDTAQVYLTRTKGGTIRSEGLIELKIGEDLKFDFEADKGYQLDYLLVDGERLNDVLGNYQLKEIRESHTVVACYSQSYETEDVIDLNEGLPWYIIAICVFGGVCIVSGGALLFCYMRKKRKVVKD